MTQINIDDINKAVSISGLTGFTGSYTPLGGGEINDTFMLECGDSKAILRVAKYPAQYTLQQEAKALRLINIEQAPRLIYFDQDSKINDRQWIMESYVSGTGAKRLNVQQFNSLGKLLAKVHSAKSGKTGIDIWATFLDACKNFGDEEKLLNYPDEDIKTLINFGRHYFKVWQLKLDVVPESLVHADATPSNVLVNGDEVSLIDWEFARFNDPMFEFSTVFYEDMEYNQGKWRVQITPEEKDALYSGYTQAGGVIDEDRIRLWMNFDKLGAATFLYWRINESGREATQEQMDQYQLDLDNLKTSLKKNMLEHS